LTKIAYSTQYLIKTAEKCRAKSKSNKKKFPDSVDNIFIASWISQ